MGGGYQVLSPDPVNTEDDPVADYVGARQDGRYLIDEWLNNKLQEGKNATAVRNKTELFEIDLENTDFLMGTRYLHSEFFYKLL